MNLPYLLRNHSLTVLSRRLHNHIQCRRFLYLAVIYNRAQRVNSSRLQGKEINRDTVTVNILFPLGIDACSMLGAIA